VLGAGTNQLHLVLTITEGSNGGYAGQLNSIDQGAILPMDSVTVQATKVHFEVKAVGGDYQGVLNVTHSGADAAREFQKMLDHLGVDPVSPYISLAYLGLARADNLMGEKTKSLKEYEHFFQLWKDADNNIPILQVARREYSALSHSAGGTAGLPESDGMGVIRFRQQDLREMRSLTAVSAEGQKRDLTDSEMNELLTVHRLHLVW